MRGLAAILLLAFGLSLASQAAETPAVDEFYAGHAALQQGEAESAITHFSKALELGGLEDTQVAYVHHYRAIAYQRIDRHQEAIEDYTDALAAGSLPKPVQAAAYYNRAIALDHLANFDRAIKDYTAAIGLKPDYAEAYMNRGNAYRKLGDNDAALKDYEASAAYGNPIKHLPYYGQGLVLEARGDKEAAFKAFQTALLLAPDFEPARLKVEGYESAGMSGGAGLTASTQAPGLRPQIHDEPAAGQGVTGATGGPAAATRVAQASSDTVHDGAPSAHGSSSGEEQASESSHSSSASSDISPMFHPEEKPQPASADPGSTGDASHDDVADTDAPTSHVASPQEPHARTAATATSKPEASAHGSSTASAAVPEAHEGTTGATGPSHAAATAVTASTAEAAGSSHETSEAAAPSKPASEAATANSGGRFLLQVAAYTDEAEAQKTADETSAKYSDLLGGLSSNIQRADLGAKGIYYRIQFGTFATKDEATERCNALKARGQDCIIVTKAQS